MIVLFSLWDFTFEFAQVTPTVAAQVAPARAEMQVQATKIVHDYVAMAPAHAKAFSNALIENIANYEKQNGPIPEIAVPQPDVRGG